MERDLIFATRNFSHINPLGKTAFLASINCGSPCGSDKERIYVSRVRKKHGPLQDEFSKAHQRRAYVPQTHQSRGSGGILKS